MHFKVFFFLFFFQCLKSGFLHKPLSAKQRRMNADCFLAHHEKRYLPVNQADPRKLRQTGHSYNSNLLKGFTEK